MGKIKYIFFFTFFIITLNTNLFSWEIGINYTCLSCLQKRLFSHNCVKYLLLKFVHFFGDVVAWCALSVSAGCAGDKIVQLHHYTPGFFLKSRRAFTWIFHSVISGPIRCSYTPTPYTHLPYLGHTNAHIAQMHTPAPLCSFLPNIPFCPFISIGSFMVS